MIATCGECNKKFDIFDELEASELLDGHDCVAY
jgi:hypothetical protein